MDVCATAGCYLAYILCSYVEELICPVGLIKCYAPRKFAEKYTQAVFVKISDYKT